ncbi:MAG TPA: TetR family transcriptional regulator [Streptosporangiaceae bacterium]|jgi:AcrR family transcriptional regulator|nr:TetR family transcriptional regulator [Streptosporangiaceae bacterium]
MAESRAFYTRMHKLLRERMLDVTAEMICAEGWHAVTMTRVADQVGVSRQSVYKEIGSKTALGEAVVARETDRVLASVIDRLRAHGADATAGIPDAAGYVLRTSADNPLIKAILLGAPGGDSDLLPLLAIRPEPVLGRAVAVVRAEAAMLYRGLLPPAAIDLSSEIVVRLTLSHLMQPTGPIEDAVAQIRALIEAVLRP